MLIRIGLAALLALSAVLTTPAPAQASPDFVPEPQFRADPAPPDVAPTSPAAMGDDWIDRFLAVLCALYMDLGGASCEEMMTPYYHIMWSVYDPVLIATTYDTPAEQDALRAQLGALKEILGESGNTVGATITGELLDWINAVEGALPVPPG